MTPITFGSLSPRGAETALKLLDADRKRLRGALETIRDLPDAAPGDAAMHVHQMREQARVALLPCPEVIRSRRKHLWWAWAVAMLALVALAWYFG